MLTLSVNYPRQEEARKTEAELNMLFDTWRARFPEKSDREILVMIAYRYADLYGSLLREKEEALTLMGELSERAGRLAEAGGKG